ncbi:MAG: ferrochelatase, partial [Methylococcaceae bacterium]|nr:ferrochelatase [Methylococcaceae bacterium]
MTKRAVLLANLGSPDKPDTKHVRSYLKQFLMDPYVIQLPWFLRKLIVSLFILPSRPKVSAQAYQSIWTKQGSPLIVLSEKLKQTLQTKARLPIAMAMRYGKPSIKSQLLSLSRKSGATEILFIPLYPHYAESTTFTSVEEAKRVIKKYKLKTKLTVFKSFYQNADYISALVSSAKPYLQQPHDHLLFSYHGLPEFHITKLDKSKKHCLKNKACCEQAHNVHKTCYRHQVFQTTHLFAKQAGLLEGSYSVAFQSRLGRAKWLGPNTEDRLRELAGNGAKNILVICPSFVTDCLETLEEIEIRG